MKKNHVNIKGLVGMIKDAFADLPFESVVVKEATRWSIDKKAYLDSIVVEYSTKTKNSDYSENKSDNKYPEYLTINHGVYLVCDDMHDYMRYAGGVWFETAETVVRTALNIVKKHAKRSKYRENVI